MGYELYAIVAEANGQALPLAFAFTTSTDGSAAEGAKDRMLQHVLGHVSEKCPKIEFVGSDKDSTEINSARAKIPQAKHQLCTWHGVRYVQERLAENKLPAKYDPRNAHKVFDFIDPTWAPGVTAGWLEDGVMESDALTAEPCEEDGKDQEDEEDESISVCETKLDVHFSVYLGIQDATCLPPLFVLTQGEQRIPIWPNPPKMKKKELPPFCPPEFRETIVQKYRIHGHQHPEIPFNDPDQPHLTADEIHRGAVRDMYNYCFQNDLSQVWAYLWNRWYNPIQWKLWARAPEPAIPRLNTTMIVESLWRNIKHRDLAEFNRPRLDLVTHIVVTNVLPRVKRRLDYIRGERRVGRGGEVAGWQKDFRSAWKDFSRTDEHRLVAKELAIRKTSKTSKNRAERLEQMAAEGEREPGEYYMDLEKWVCSCPAFLISRFLLCKHLVREANTKLNNKPLSDLSFFANLRRNHFPPYYNIAGIHCELDADSDQEDAEEIEILVLGRGISRSQPASSRTQTPVNDHEDETQGNSEDQDRDEGRGTTTTQDTSLNNDSDAEMSIDEEESDERVS